MSRNSEPRRRAAWTATGGALLAGALATLALSDAFAYEIDVADTPVTWLVAVGMASGAVYLALPRLIRRSHPSAPLIAGMIGLGFALRLAMLPSTPILEDDVYRYLWDGAVVSAGIDPYAHAPSEVLADTLGEDIGDGAALARLAGESGVILERVNHPHLRTIYPPAAQAVFALANGLAPWNLTAWRGVLLVFDAATLALITALLATLGRSPLWAALYWWNPLVVKELFNSAHMDGLLLPFMLGAVLLAVRGRPVWAAGALAIAAGMKLWPVLLLPVILRTAWCDARAAAAAVPVFAALAGAMAWPVIAAGLGPDSGFTAYGRTWEMNDALFMAVAWGMAGALDAANIAAYHAGILARLAVVAALAALVAWQCRAPADTAEALCGRVLAVVAALFLLGPTAYPWYYVWMAPFLAVTPRFSLLALSALLPLYYLRFHFDARGAPEVFDHGIVWLEYLPVWALLVWELARDGPTRARRAADAG